MLLIYLLRTWSFSLNLSVRYHVSIKSQPWGGAAAQWSLLPHSKKSLHILLVFAWVSAWCSSFLMQIKDMYVRVNTPISAPDLLPTGVGPRVLHYSCPLLLVFVCKMGQMQRINFPTGIDKVLLLLLSSLRINLCCYLWKCCGLMYLAGCHNGDIECYE